MQALYKMVEDAGAKPIEEHTRVISQFLETYKLRALNHDEAQARGKQSQKSPYRSSGSNRVEEPPKSGLFDRLEGELTGIVETFQRER